MKYLLRLIIAMTHTDGHTDIKIQLIDIYIYIYYPLSMTGQVAQSRNDYNNTEKYDVYECSIKTIKQQQQQ